MATSHSESNICLETDMDSTAVSTTMHSQLTSCCTEPTEGVSPDVVDATLDKLLSKTKSEEMFELRKLKHQQRPVSEFCSKQQLEEFFSKRMPPPQLDVSAASEPSASSLVSDRAKQLTSSSTNGQDFMPEGVRLEVRGLFEQRRVTETLQGPLRQEMNRVLQQNIERRQRGQQGRRTRSRPMHQGHREVDDAGERLIAAIRGRQRPRRPRRPRRHVRFVPPENGQYPMPRRDQSQIVESLTQSPALNSLDAEAREEIVSEVRNLVQQQLVTSALSGQFRGVLELNIQQRVNLSQQGLSGEDFIQSLRQGRSSPRPRATADEGEHGEESSGAHYSELRRDMREMKSQLADLKQMMTVSFDLQLDIQRSIRQEVAAALSAFLAPQQQHDAASGGVGVPLQPPQACPVPTLRAPEGHASVVQATSQTVHVPVVECGRCAICSDGVIDCVVYRCGHMSMCMSCGLELKSKGLKCPICRAPITDVIRAYASMM